MLRPVPRISPSNTPGPISSIPLDPVVFPFWIETPPLPPVPSEGPPPPRPPVQNSYVSSISPPFPDYLPPTKTVSISNPLHPLIPVTNLPVLPWEGPSSNWRSRLQI